jgi:hypothetical protein
MSTTNFDFTEKTEESIADAIQLAKDYANAQGYTSFCPLTFSLPLL